MIAESVFFGTLVLVGVASEAEWCVSNRQTRDNRNREEALPSGTSFSDGRSSESLRFFESILFSLGAVVRF